VRRDHQPIHVDTETTDYTFHFQISNGGGRRACTVKVQAPNIHDATKFFRQNWQIIEVMAHEVLADRSRENGEIRLVVP
jgi:acyl dehydratase